MMKKQINKKKMKNNNPI